MAMEEFVILFMAAFAMLGSPGPAPIALAASGAAWGYRATLPFYAGIMAGLFAAMLLSAFGFAALIAAVPAAAVLLLALSLCYVLYIAWGIASAPPIERSQLQAAGKRRPRPVDGFIINIVNPKVYAAFATLYASFVPAQLEGRTGIAAAGLAGFAIALVMNNVWMLAGEGLARLFSSPRQNRILRLVLAGLMVLAVLLAVYKLWATGLFANA
ncbi:hypothetical protein GCM10011342_17250 [Aquisalinus flavus]|uniref:Lysine exporter protein (LYSE/YGGA) n=3 Tax=Aquisalinus flavus TaxID=1526572 RepID=A0A8J2V584_9PROT|nr:LysE family translocator [Aquisalinus flavus]GGD08954.1 hypothetical protein GCM10011342_17250 [Aquisalinus flavus]